MSNHIGQPGGPPEENGKLWIRDNTGAALEISDVWIREEGQLRKIDKIWIRDNSYANSSAVHYDNLPEPLIAPPTPTYNEQAFAKGHKREIYIPESVGDPTESGTINDAAVLNHIGNVAWLNDAEYGILDFENPYMAWLAQGVSNPPDDNYYQALTEMIDLIQQVKAAFPQIKWAFYGEPNVRFFVYDNTWYGLEQSNQHHLINERLDQYVAAYGPLLDKQDYISPSFFDKYVAPERSEQTKRWVHYNIEASKRHNEERNQNKLIIPMLCPMYQYINIGDDYLPIFVGSEEVRDEMIYPALENGSYNNFTLWSGQTFWVPSAFNLSTYPLDWTVLPQNEQAMGQRISRYRAAYTEEFFNGVAPDWNSPEDEETLRHAVCQRMIQYMDDMKADAIEKLQTNPITQLVYEI